MKVKELMRLLATYDPDFDVRVRRATTGGTKKYGIANQVQPANFGYFGTDTRLDNFNSKRKEPDSVVIVCERLWGYE